MNLKRIIDAESARSTKQYIVTLTEEERSTLEQLPSGGRTAARKLRHAWVLLKADACVGPPGWTDEQIRDAYGVSLATIARVRRAFVAEGVTAALTRQASVAARPRKMAGEQEAHLVALMCRAVPEGHSRWTVRLLADKFVELAGTVEVSRETVRRVLKEKRVAAVATEAVVYPTGGERRLRLSHGGRARRGHPAL